MLLDTCALLWLSQGGRQLSPAARAGIESARIVFISAITGFEVGIKCRAGKLRLPATPSEWLQTVLAHHDIRVEPISLAVCTTAVDLPLVHRDPCDRLIIATARLHHWPVVTADSRFKDYGVEVVW